MVVALTQVSVFRSGTLLFEKVLPPGEYVIGGDAGADISFSAPGISPRHAILGLHQSGWVIEDLGGGTFVDNKPIQNRHTILPTQRISVGDAIITLHRWMEENDPEASLPPVTAAVRDLLPKEIRGEHKFAMGPLLAEGGMGVILNARELPVHRDVAMKLMRGGGRRGDVERFVREAQVTARLEHPNIVPVYELGVNELDEPFYTMKLVRGVSLRHVLDLLRGRDPAIATTYSLSALLIIFQKVCDAVAFAHSRGVIHRDLKPDNIMLGEYGEVLVMDWGLAKVIAEPEASRFRVPDAPPEEKPGKSGQEPAPRGATVAGMVVGTLQYMAPEQACGKIEQLDEACDIYALGAILHYILALRPPIEGTSDEEVLSNVCAGRHRSLHAQFVEPAPHLPGGTIPASLRAVVEKAMALQPRARYATVKSLQADIAAYQSGFATVAEDATPLKRIHLFIRRHRTACTAAGLLFIASLISISMLAVARERAHTAERVAYVADMLEAGRYIMEGRVDGARELLTRHATRDLRGWEWFHLSSQLNNDLLCTHAHPGGVFALAAKMEGSELASGGADGDIALWQPAGLKLQRRWHAHQGAVLSLAWHRDGTLLASGGADGAVRIWDTKTGAPLAERRLENGGKVYAVAWQPLEDGSGGLAIGGTDQNVLLWFPLLSNAPPPRKLFSAGNGVASLDWSKDGARLACGKLDAAKSVEVFDLFKESMAVSNRPTDGNDVLSVALNSTGTYVAAGSKHFTIAVFDVATGRLAFERDVHRGPVRAVAWSPTDARLASASQDGTIRIFDQSHPDAAPQVFCGHAGDVAALVWIRISNGAGRGRRTALFSGGSDGTLRGWAPEAMEQTGVQVKEKRNWIAAARWSPDSTQIAMVDFHNYVQVIERTSGAKRILFSALNPLFDVAWSPHGDQLLVASRRDGRAEILDAATGKSIAILALPYAEHVAWSPSGKYFVAAGIAGACTWNAQTGEKIATIPRPTGAVTWHPDDRQLVVGGMDGAIELWEGMTGKKKVQWRAPPPDSGDTIASKYDVPTQIAALRWSPDLRYIAFGTMDKVAALIDVHEGRVIRTFSRHTGGVRGVAWSQDSRRVATCSLDGALRLFIADTGDLVARLNHGHGNLEVHCVDWSADGRQLLTGGYDLAVRIWDASRSYLRESSEELKRRSRDDSSNPALWWELAESYAKLGRADLAYDAIEKWKGFPHAADVGVGMEEISGRIDGILNEALLDPLRTSSTSPIVPDSSTDNELLNVVAENLKEESIGVAAAAFRELLARGTSPQNMALARSYFSRAKWKVTWFSSPIDAQHDREGWRDQAKSADAVTATVRMLTFPYKERARDRLLLLPEWSESAPLKPPFGMIARANVLFGNQKWRLRVRGSGDVRVIIDGRVLLEETNPVLFEKTEDYESPHNPAGDVIVEHFTRSTVAPFEFMIEPLADGASRPASAAFN